MSLSHSELLRATKREIRRCGDAIAHGSPVHFWERRLVMRRMELAEAVRLIDEKISKLRSPPSPDKEPTK